MQSKRLKILRVIEWFAETRAFSPRAYSLKQTSNFQYFSPLNVLVSVDRSPFLRYTYFCICDVRGSIAQLGEHLPYKQGVTGSSPVVPTKSLQWPGSTVG